MKVIVYFSPVATQESDVFLGFIICDLGMRIEESYLVKGQEAKQSGIMKRPRNMRLDYSFPSSSQPSQTTCIFGVQTTS